MEQADCPYWYRVWWLNKMWTEYASISQNEIRINVNIKRLGKKIAMLNSRFGYSMKKNSFKGLNIDCIQYSNIIRITYYSYLYWGTIMNLNIIRIHIRPNIIARILFIFVFAHSEKTNIIRIRIRSKFWFRILFVFVFGPKNSIRSPLIQNLNYP